MGRKPVPVPTFGGRFLWGDELVQNGWRIQSHIGNGKFRLLSPAKFRLQEGSLDDCLTVLEEQNPKSNAAHIVLLLHGLGRSWASMEPLARMLHHKGLDAQSLTYPSTRAGVQDHAGRLIRILHRLEGVREVDFVTHSLGGIVVREAVSRLDEWPDTIRPRRIVMLAPPYNGAAMARLFQNVGPVRSLLGAALEDLARENSQSDLGRRSEVPEFIELLIIAGGRGDKRGLNPLIKGDDDGTVAVEETRPKRPHDFLLIKAPHSFMMRKQDVADAVLAYLKD